MDFRLRQFSIVKQSIRKHSTFQLGIQRSSKRGRN